MLLEQSIFAHGCFNDARQSKGLSLMRRVPSTMHGDPFRDRRVCSLQSKGYSLQLTAIPTAIPPMMHCDQRQSKGVSLSYHMMPRSRRVFSLQRRSHQRRVRLRVDPNPVSRCTAILTNQMACLPPMLHSDRRACLSTMVIPLSHIHPMHGGPNQSEGVLSPKRDRRVCSRKAIPLSYAIKGRVSLCNEQCTAVAIDQDPNQSKGVHARHIDARETAK